MKKIEKVREGRVRSGAGRRILIQYWLKIQRYSFKVVKDMKLLK